MQRRDFLSTVGALLASSAAMPRQAIAAVLNERSHEAVPDVFHVDGWDVRWIGWRQPANQLEIFGVWVALPADKPGSGRLVRISHDIQAWVSCTLGGTRLSRAFELFDTTFYREHGSMIYGWSTEAEKLTAKREALKRLIVSIKTGEAYGVRS